MNFCMVGESKSYISLCENYHKKRTMTSNINHTKFHVSITIIDVMVTYDVTDDRSHFHSYMMCVYTPHPLWAAH